MTVAWIQVVLLLDGDRGDGGGDLPCRGPFSVCKEFSPHDMRGSSAHAKVSNEAHGSGKNQHAEFSRPSSSSGHAGSSSRPSSNYGNRSQQVLGPPKGINKEWKPKPINSSNVLVSRTSTAPEQSCAAPEQSPTDAAKTGELNIAVHDDISGSEEPASKVEQELEGLHIRDAQHVIIPNHIHVPEAVRTTLTFGSFEAAVVIGMLKGSEHTSDSCQVIEDLAVEEAVRLVMRRTTTLERWSFAALLSN